MLLRHRGALEHRWPLGGILGSNCRFIFEHLWCILSRGTAPAAAQTSRQAVRPLARPATCADVTSRLWWGRLKLCGLTTSCPPAATNGWIPETQERFGWGRGDGQSVNRRHRGLDGHARCQSGHRDDPRPPLQQGTVTSPAHMWGLLRPLSGMLMSCDPSEQSRRDAPPPHWPGSLLDYLLHTACFACCAHLLSSF